MGSNDGLSIATTATTPAPQLELALEYFQTPLAEIGFGTASQEAAAASKVEEGAIAEPVLDPNKRYPALQSSFSLRKSLDECPRQNFEWMRRTPGRLPDADPADRNVFLKTSLKTSPEFLGHAVHDAISYALTEACGRKLGESQFAPSRIVSLEELLERASRTYSKVIGLSAGASRLHFAINPDRFPLFVEDVLEMNGKPLIVEGKGRMPMYQWREELWKDIKICIQNFYTLVFAPENQTLTGDGKLAHTIGGFSQLKPGRFPHGDFVSIEGWQESDFSSDSIGIETSRAAEWAHFKMPITHKIRDTEGNLRQQKFNAKNICIIDFAYAEPDRANWQEGSRSPGKVYICDWKTNRLDAETNRPGGRKTKDHLQQLSEYALFIMESFPELTPHDIILRVYYLRDEGIPLEKRVEEYSAASLDSSPKMARTHEKIRRAIEDRANRFFDPVTGQTDVSLWPYTEKTYMCNYCKIASDCGGAPEEARETWTFDLVSATKLGRKDSVDEGLRR
jgi:hypothetical protein